MRVDIKSHVEAHPQLTYIALPNIGPKVLPQAKKGYIIHLYDH